MKDFLGKKDKKPFRMKFDTSLRVSYPVGVYEDLRKWSFRKGITMQDFQRRAAEFYINHLEQDFIQTQKEKKQ